MQDRQGRQTIRRGRNTLRPIAVLCSLAVFGGLFQTQAHAQQRPKTIVEMLFGGGARTDAPPPRVIRERQAAPSAAKRKPSRSSSRQSSKPRRSEPKATARAAPSNAVKAAPAIADKSEDARVVLVVGDFLADSLADGLKSTYAEDANVEIVSRTNGSSGLVREDFYDWSQELGPMIDEFEPAVLAVMIGSNDRQPLNVGGTNLAVRSDGWTAEYEKRATDIARIAEDKEIPLVWVGMPAFKYDRMSEDMVFFNDIYRRSSERVSGEYVDIWDGFVDADGEFVYSGPDVNGQTTQLRGQDGVNMTSAGDDKLAFYAEKPLARILGSADPALALGEDAIAGAGAPQQPGNLASAVQAAPVSLADPLFEGGGTDLMGMENQPLASLELSPRDRLILNGEIGERPQGRADNFAWNDKAASVRQSDAPVAYRGSIDLQTVRQQSGIKPPKEMPSILDAIIEDWENSDPDAEPNQQN